MISAVQTGTGGDIVLLTPVTPGDGVVGGKFCY